MKTYIVVLGAPVILNQSSWLKSRLDESIKLYNEIKDKDTYFVVTGKGYGIINESEAMKQYLEENGISKDIILCESESYNTYENAICTYKLLHSMEFSDNDRIYLVTSDFHMERAICLFSKIEHITNILAINSINISFREAKTDITNNTEHQKAVDHEKKSVEYLKNRYHLS